MTRVGTSATAPGAVARRFFLFLSFLCAGLVSAADYDTRRKEIIKNLTGTDVKKTPGQSDSSASSGSSVPAPVTSVGLYSKVAPAARDAFDPRFGSAPKNVMEKGQRPEDFNLEHDSHYPFGQDKAGVGDADQLQSFLDDLEVKLQGVKVENSVVDVFQNANCSSFVRRITSGTRRSRTSCRRE